MAQLKMLPVGIEDFKSFSEQNYYYIDKTGLIIDLINNGAAVNLFTRPRRFGKSLNMSMLKSFFEIGSDPILFDGLKVRQAHQIWGSHFGKYPVVSITLKGVSGLRYQSARSALADVIGNEALRFQFLLDSSKLSATEKAMYSQLIKVTPSHSHASTAGGNTDELDAGIFRMTDAVLVQSLYTLSALLHKHYEKKVILLIDEYDVPLDRAFQSGYYTEMAELLRTLLSNSLKTNEHLQNAVLTGCLRISKESVFTGLNNLRVNSITDNAFDEYFGFTDNEVRMLLDYYGLSDHYTAVKKWYDGYQFGSTSVYCPWDVVNYCFDAQQGTVPPPKDYWSHTSGNNMISLFINKASAQTRSELEQLVAGKSIMKPIVQELTYSELDRSIDNLWSVLFTTGYLTQRGFSDGKYELTIPNIEIRDLFIQHIESCFKEAARMDHTTIGHFCEAFPNGDAESIEKQMNRYLWNSISVRDDAVRNDLRENFYHGMLLGLLQSEESWIVKSNAESGLGYSDLLIETPEGIGIVIELKYASDSNLEKHCADALAQIESKEYAARLLDDGMEKIVKYGIAFYKKRCKVRRA